MPIAAAPIAVVVGDFEDLVAHGLRSVLAEDEGLELLADRVPTEALAAAVAEVEPDVALVNYAGLRTPVQVNQLHEQHPETRIVVLVDRASVAECNQLLAFGATAVVTKDTPKQDLLTAIRLAHRGMQVTPGPSGMEPEPMGPDLLTPREAEVLELLQLGRSNAQIAAELHVGLETVRTHARNIYRKLGVTSRRELAAAPRLRR
jgi:DNA-binding NarL/FixJ family response regulator